MIGAAASPWCSDSELLCSDSGQPGETGKGAEELALSINDTEDIVTSDEASYGAASGSCNLARASENEAEGLSLAVGDEEDLVFSEILESPATGPEESEHEAEGLSPFSL
jgi:hypothetical protein